MIYTLTGSNEYEIKKFFTNLKTEFISKYGETGVENYTGEQLNPEIIANALGGISLFATNRMVIIRGLNEAKDVVEQLLKQLKSVPDDIELILIEPNLDKRTSLYKTLKNDTEFKEFSNLSEPELIGWIQSEVKNQAGQITPASARKLYDYCGFDQLRLSNEIQKLVSYDTNVSNENIELLVDKNPRDTIFELLDLALSGESVKSVAKLQSLEAMHEDPFQIASMLIWQAHILSIVQTTSSLGDSEIAKIYKINPFVITKTKRLIKNRDLSTLKKIVNKVAKLDITLKTNSHDPWRALEQTLFAL